MILPANKNQYKDIKTFNDLHLLIKFIEVYCQGHHSEQAECDLSFLKYVDLKELTNKLPDLCPDCQKLLTHALVKRSTCPMDPKPTCKHCTKHCYHPHYRQQIREVMKYSGKKLVLRGRIDYLIHLLF